MICTYQFSCNEAAEIWEVESLLVLWYRFRCSNGLLLKVKKFKKNGTFHMTIQAKMECQETNVSSATLLLHQQVSPSRIIQEDIKG